jgi:hypothetical protein
MQRLRLKVQKLQANDGQNSTIKHRIKSIPFLILSTPKINNQNAKNGLSEHEHGPFALSMNQKVHIHGYRTCIIDWVVRKKSRDNLQVLFQNE